MQRPEIEAAVSKLSADVLCAFTRWFEEFLADDWDRQIEADIRSGKLDKAGRRADASIDARNHTKL